MYTGITVFPFSMWKTKANIGLFGFGGFSSASLIGTKLDMDTDTLSNPLTFTTTRWGCSALVDVQNNLGFYIGGTSGSGYNTTFQSSVDKTNLSSMTFSAGATFYYGIRDGYYGSSLTGGYVIGGWVGQSSYASSVIKGLYATETYSNISSVNQFTVGIGYIQSKTHVYRADSTGKTGVSSKLSFATDTFSNISVPNSWNGNAVQNGGFGASGTEYGYQIATQSYYSPLRIAFATDTVSSISYSEQRFLGFSSKNKNYLYLYSGSTFTNVAKYDETTTTYGTFGSTINRQRGASLTTTIYQ